jgi:hypothetical protein
MDEFRTSCLNYKTEEKSENLYLPDKKGKIRKIHSILTYKTENGRLGCINRDENAVNNMIKIVTSYLKDKSRPEKYKRSYKFPVEKEKMATSQERCQVSPSPSGSIGRMKNETKMK